MKIKPIENAGGVIVELGPGESQLPEPAGIHRPEFQLKRILVPLDFSECSKKALRYAVAFAKQFGSEITLLHVLEPMTKIMEWAPMEMESFEAARKELQTIQEKLTGNFVAVSHLREGPPHSEIVQEAKDLAVDLIIISTHGRTGLEHILMGSVAEKVVRHAPCPVLIVRETGNGFIAKDSNGVTENEGGTE